MRGRIQILYERVECWSQILNLTPKGDQSWHGPGFFDPCKRQYLKHIDSQAAIEGHDDPWPFFHFWRHHFWPKLASSMFNFCSRRRSFQWCPDQSDRPTGAWDMHKNAQKVKRKTQTKICCHYTGLLHGESCPSRWRFPRSFLTASKPSRRSITAAKRKEKERKEKPKKIVKNRKA